MHIIEFGRGKDKKKRKKRKKRLQQVTQGAALIGASVGAGAATYGYGSSAVTKKVGSALDKVTAQQKKLTPSALKASRQNWRFRSDKQKKILRSFKSTTKARGKLLDLQTSGYKKAKLKGIGAGVATAGALGTAIYLKERNKKKKKKKN